jgi:hypothetical protein
VSRPGLDAKGFAMMKSVLAAAIVAALLTAASAGAAALIDGGDVKNGS